MNNTGGALAADPSCCPTPTFYCTAKVNSQACLPQIAYTGSPSLSGPDNFFVTATSVSKRKPGILIWSHDPADLPFQGGKLTKGVCFPVCP